MINKPHGIMYHHFHDESKHIKGQGSISADTFEEMIDYYARQHNLIGAEEFMARSEKGTLGSSDVCLTFDDGLLCQYDIAYPVLKRLGLTAFWFIYTSPLEGVLEKLEIYRHFRFSMYKDIEDFYEAFFDILRGEDKQAYSELNSYDPDSHYLECPFYTPNDKRFRFLRDDILGPERYYAIMDAMIEDSGYDTKRNSSLLWMNAEQIRNLHRDGHIIGLHSHTHPTVLENLDYDGQRNEYVKNKVCLEKVLGECVSAVSYPCNSYNNDTLRCMHEFGIRIGFRADTEDVCKGDPKLEYPREDHANILREMRDDR